MEIVVIGNPTIDKIYVNGCFIRKSVGGGIYYSLEALKETYGRQYRISVITAISPHQYSWLSTLRRSGVEVIAYPTTLTNVFVLKYRSGKRRIYIEEKSPPLIFSLDKIYDVAIVNPVMNEILPHQLRITKIKTRFTAIDIQGFIRRCKDKFIEYYRPPHLKDLFRFSNVVHMNDDEAQYLTGAPHFDEQVKKLVGLSPNTIFIVSSPEHVAMGTQSLYEYIEVPDIRYQDTTGAGDYLLTVFAVELYRSNDPMISLVRATKKTQEWLNRKNASSRPATPNHHRH